MEEEIWKPIDEYEGLYEVSNLGRVRSLDALVPIMRGFHRLRKGRILRQNPNKKGYLCVVLSKSSKMKTFGVHRLVADAFLGSKPLPDAQINHVDFDRQNNIARNLEWTTALENTHHSLKAGRYAKTISAETAATIKQMLEAGHRQMDIARQLDVSRKIVGNVASGKQWIYA